MILKPSKENKKKTKKTTVVRIKREPQPIEPREKSQRIRKPNTMLKGFAEINDRGEITKESGGAIIGGKIYYFKA